MDKAHEFKEGDGATYAIRSDSYPVTVRRVSASGKSLWASKDKIKYLESPLYKEGELKCDFAPDDSFEESELMKFKVKVDKKGNEYWAEPGKHGCYLYAGRSHKQDPCK